MYRLSSRGFGAVNWLGNQCVAGVDFGCPAPAGWLNWFGMQQSTIAPPGAPTGSVLTVPPASGAQAQATVDALLNQQLVDQNALNATAVQSSWLDQAASGAVSAGNVLSSPWIWLALGLGAYGLMVIGVDQPRRYGR